MARQKQSIAAWSEELNFSMLELTHGLPKGLLAAVCNQESRGDPNALSPAGAQGLFQFMPGTAGDFSIDPFDPAQAADGAARYLSQHLSRHNGDIAKALACYNWGQGNVAKAITKYGDDWLKHAPAETRDYVAKVTSAMGGQVYNSPLLDRSVRRPTQDFDEYERSRSSQEADNNWLKQMTSGLSDVFDEIGAFFVMMIAAAFGSRQSDQQVATTTTPPASAPTTPANDAPFVPPAPSVQADQKRAQEQAVAAMNGCTIPGNGVCVAQAEAQSNLPFKAPWEVDLGLRG